MTNLDPATNVAETPMPEPPSSEPPSSDPAPAAMSERVQALRLAPEESQEGNTRRRWPWVLLLLAIAGGGFYAYRNSQRPEGLFGSVYEVETVLANYEQPVAVVLDTTGYIATKETVKVSSRVPGTIVELSVSTGDVVEEGQLLARIDDVQFQADVDHAQASLASAKARLAELKSGSREEELKKAESMLAQAQDRRDHLARELERARLLQDTISPSEFESTESKHDEAVHSVEQLSLALKLLRKGAREEAIQAAGAEVARVEALLAKAKFMLEYTELRAPIAGTILKLNVDPGQLVAPESITGTVCEIANLQQLEAEIDIQERDLPEVSLNQHCYITTEAYPDRRYEGRLTWLSPIYNRQRGVRAAKVVVSKPDEFLSPDMNCRVQLLAEQPPENAQERLLLPKQAVVAEGGKSYVYVVTDDVVTRREVEIAAATSADGSQDEQVEIRSGLDGGEVVALPGEKPLVDGQSVRPKRRDKAAAEAA